MIQMKSRNILIASFAALFLASSCSDVMEPDEIVKANPGDEVVFGAASKPPDNSVWIFR